MYLRLISDALVKIGHDVDVLTFDGNYIALGNEVRNLTVCEESGVMARPVRLLEKLLNLGKISELGSYLTTFLTLRMASRMVKKHRYDAVHILDAHPYVISHLMLATSVKNCTVAFNLNFTSPRQQLADWGQRFRHSLRKREFRICRHLLATKVFESGFMEGVQKRLFRKAASRNRLVLVTHSKPTQDSYKERFFYERTVCIPWGMEKTERTLTQQQARQHLDLSQDEKILLSFGVNHTEKNFEVVFQAIQELPKEFRILHAGKIDTSIARNDPRALAEQYGWSENIVIDDRYIPKEEMQYFFLAADGIILSYTRDFLHASGVLSHASEFALPVIASDVGQLGQLVTGNQLGLTFATEDSQSLKQAITSFLSLSEEQTTAMRKNLEEFAGTFSWEDVAQKHVEAYQGALGGGGAA